jgi:hypothetical protein
MDLCITTKERNSININGYRIKGLLKNPYLVRSKVILTLTIKGILQQPLSIISWKDQTLLSKFVPTAGLTDCSII